MPNVFSSLVVAGLVVVATAGQGFARLGETEAELETRYGKPQSVKIPPEVPAPAEKSLCFVKEGVTVVVLVFRGRSASESYFFKDKDGAEVPVERDLRKAEALLQANSGGGSWGEHAPELVNPGLAMVWARSDQKAIASVYKSQPNALRVEDALFMKEMMNSGKQSEAGLKGF